jgi:hypothetical protein
LLSLAGDSVGLGSSFGFADRISWRIPQFPFVHVGPSESGSTIFAPSSKAGNGAAASGGNGATEQPPVVQGRHCPNDCPAKQATNSNTQTQRNAKYRIAKPPEKIVHGKRPDLRLTSGHATISIVP